MKKDTYPRSRRIIKLRGKMSDRVAIVIANNYDSLKESICADIDISCNGATQEDVFSDTVLYVIHEQDIEEMEEDKILAHFKRRFNMLLFRAKQENRTIQKNLNERYGIH